MARNKITKEYIVGGISQSLRDFGYPDATGDVITEIYDAFKDGKRGDDLPHGVIGRFAEDQLRQIEEMLKVLP